ncbi:MAG: hypothetical protein WC979_01675 [Candidatus Pacearchaeota archaeon]|nr:hypothetical protein [Clostridia bacterium]
MKLYVTNADYEKVKNSFLNFRSFSVINVQDIIKSFNYNSESMNEYSQFIVNNEIQSILRESIAKKKFFNIIYINTELTIEKIENLKEYINDTESIDKFIFIDDEENSNKDVYPLFDEIILYPKTKRVRIMQCDTIKNPMYYWINNR